MPSTFGTAVRLVAVAALAAVLGGCATGNIWLPAPKTDTENSALEPDKALEEDRRIVERYGVVAKTELSEHVAAVGAKVADGSDCPSKVRKFAVLESPEPRAFSTGGGYVYINRGLMEMLRSENELAAVLAHEVAHICTHDADAARQEAVGHAAAWGNMGLLWSINPWALTGIFLLPEIALLPALGTSFALSRHDEFNADRHGAEYLRRAGYPPEGMSEALEILAGLEAHDGDHPAKGERVFGRPVIPMGHIYDDHPSAAKRMAKLGHISATRTASSRSGSQ